jgi:hypothetical protein
LILHPAIIALIGGSLLICIITIYSSLTGIQILRWWDINSGSERQLLLERKTYLISTALSAVLSFEVLSLFLFIYTADNIHTLFRGAMCAAGTLHVNSYGYPTLIIKTINCLLCGLWLIVNFADNQGHDYPLIRKKYSFLLLITLLIIAETISQFLYFLNLKGDVITSCCGTLFSADTRGGVVSDLVALPPQVAMIAFFVTGCLTIGTGLYYLMRQKKAWLFSMLSLLFMCVAIVSILSFISLYFYELPTHHCPFCILQKQYMYVGYPLYVFLFGGTIMGMGVGALSLFKSLPSLVNIIPSIQRKLAIYTLIFYGLFLGISIYPMVVSDFKLTMFKPAMFIKVAYMHNVYAI